MTDESQNSGINATCADAKSAHISGARLSALSKAPTRRALRYLHQQETATLDEIADAICGMLAVETDGVVTPAQRDRVRITLYHVTLPRLDDLNYIEYDHESRTVTETTIPDAVHSIVAYVE